ncbi:hypothetical protein T09_9993 [Trichinella sp. T9]|nr:hypothetical protein T09_9993 [Trichinella sp. T9]
MAKRREGGKEREKESNCGEESSQNARSLGHCLHDC